MIKFIRNFIILVNIFIIIKINIFIYIIIIDGCAWYKRKLLERSKQKHETSKQNEENMDYNIYDNPIPSTSTGNYTLPNKRSKESICGREVSTNDLVKFYKEKESKVTEGNQQPQSDSNNENSKSENNKKHNDNKSNKSNDFPSDEYNQNNYYKVDDSNNKKPKEVNTETNNNDNNETLDNSSKEEPILLPKSIDNNKESLEFVQSKVKKGKNIEEDKLRKEIKKAKKKLKKLKKERKAKEIKLKKRMENPELEEKRRLAKDMSSSKKNHDEQEAIFIDTENEDNVDNMELENEDKLDESLNVNKESKNSKDISESCAEANINSSIADTNIDTDRHIQNTSQEEVSHTPTRDDSVDNTDGNTSEKDDSSKLGQAREWDLNAELNWSSKKNKKKKK